MTGNYKSETGSGFSVCLSENNPIKSQEKQEEMALEWHLMRKYILLMLYIIV